MRTNHYDVVVFGEDLAGLIAANLLGRRGLRVLILGHDPSAERLPLGPHVLPARPPLLPWPGLEPVRRVFAALNLTPIVRRRARRLQPAVQFLHGEEPVPVDADPAEVAGAFGAPVDATRATLRSLHALASAVAPALDSEGLLPPTGFWARRELARYAGQLASLQADALSELPSHAPLRATLIALAALGTAFAPADLGRVPVAHALAMARDGLCLLDDDGPGPRGLLLDKLATVSVEPRAHSGVAAIDVHRGRVIGLRLSPRDEPVGLQQLIWSAPLSTLPALPEERASRRVREMTTAIHPTCRRYCLLAVLPETAIDPRWGPRLVTVIDPARPPLEDNALCLTQRPLPDPRGPLRTLWIECLVPAAVLGQDRSYLSFVRSRVLGHLARLVPGWESQVLALASADDGLPAEWRGPDGLRPVDGPLPAGPLPVAVSSDLPRALDLSAAPYATGLRNLHVASAENLPGLGLLGQFIAGWNVARRVAARSPARRDGVGRTVLSDDA